MEGRFRRKTGRQPTRAEEEDWAAFCSEGAMEPGPREEGGEPPQLPETRKREPPPQRTNSPAGPASNFEGGREPTASEHEDWKAYASGETLPPVAKEDPRKQSGERDSSAARKLRAGNAARKAQHEKARPEDRVERKIREKLRRGKISPEAVLDLHGMTRVVAEYEVAKFVNISYRSHRRLLLIITGKGMQSSGWQTPESERGVLRRMVPEMLRSKELGGRVMHIQEAHTVHGGAGALYVYLKRNRSTGMR